MKNIYNSKIVLPEYPKNLMQMLAVNLEKYSDNIIYQEISDNEYKPLKWHQFIQNISCIQTYLHSIGFKEGDSLAILSQNRKEMLELEFAVMSMGGCFIPIFSGYFSDIANILIDFCEADYIAVADEIQLSKLDNLKKFKKIIYFDEINKQSVNLISINDIFSTSKTNQELQGLDIDPNAVCLKMYTSGTMGNPKLVELTHGNILSQQSAMKVLWNLDNSDRFLSYLPWHHSFGGIFEKYSAICSGSTLSLDDSYGKDMNKMISNWKSVKPTVFFSVPRIYQALTTLMSQNKELKKLIFHDELKFVFTAAAPLPENISDMFDANNIPVYEGWGLTETSPCCTITNPKLQREVGVVGKPIPGISIKLSKENEILVKGPNVMHGYYNNPEETKKVLSNDRWFSTGDVGKITDTGLKLISRIDRIFKLSNAEKIIPTEIENILYRDCAYMTHCFVSGSGKDYPIVLVFPNKEMFKEISDKTQLMKGCKCPINLDEYAKCLKNCLGEWNTSIDTKYSKLKKARILDYELSIESGELTPSLKLAPNIVGKVFNVEIESLYQSSDVNKEQSYIISVD